MYHINVHKYALAVFTLSLVIGLAGFAPSTQGASFPENAVTTLQLPEVEDADILQLDDTVKHWLDTHIAPIRRATHRATLLHLMLFNRAYRGILYDGSTTKTALQTWYSGSGNCVSLASLYVAAARYVGLNAKFQSVKIPREWLEKEGFYLIPGHVNAAIKLPQNNVTVEFADIYPAADTKSFESKRISDKHMLAEYYNNMGMENLERGAIETAMAYLIKSIQTDHRIDFVWSNLGVTFKMLGMVSEAEKAYKKALRLKRSNLSTLNNLYVLYIESDQAEKAEKLRKKVRRYSKRNPFYLYRLAQTEFKFRNYASAKSLIERALRIKADNAKFHLLLGKIHFQSGDLIASAHAINQAKQLAQGQQESDDYQVKLDALERLRANL